MDDLYQASSAESQQSPGANSSRNGSDSHSPETNPSSTNPSPRRGKDDASGHSRQVSDLFSNLDNYLALGCLCFEDLTELDEDQDAGSWRDITQSPPMLAFDEPLSSHLRKLAVSGWIRIFSIRSSADPRYLVFRIYILPLDVGRGIIDRQNKRLCIALESLVAEIDVSSEAWRGSYTPESACKFDKWATRDEGSLFWKFNQIPSPSPSLDVVEEKYAREALEDLLDPASALPGLKTQLYPYQRRSAGLMLQRESVASLELDPRLERRTAPDGSQYYYGARDLVFFREPRYYEACRGGVLAETMGLGKTVMCLALILATKDHLPKVPTPYSMPPIRQSIASLTDMAISAINRKSIPWEVEFQRVQHATGNDMINCREKLKNNPAAYEIPVEPMRWNRKTIQPPAKKMTLASTTLIVVPRNLSRQWLSEIKKHVDSDLLRVLVMDNGKKALPPPDELRANDIIIFTRSRFEMEIRDGADDQGRRIGATSLLCRCPYIGATRTRDCHCIRTDELYDSPLKHLHFKRLIIDEGHFFSNSNNTAVSVANKLITADHRWVVSGTPAKDLLGVEVDMSASENLWHTPDTKDSRDAILEQRRHFSKKDDTSGAIKSLGSLATNFLKIQPWAPVDTNERRVDWEEYVYRHEDSRKRTFSGFSTGLMRTMKAMVVKTQPEDVEKDIDLPPLSHEVVRLEPSFYDKLTANLFTLVLTANAITSERTDVDYLFHKNSQKARTQLISNLRQSAFFWTGFSEADVVSSLKSSQRYLEKPGTACTDSDRALLKQTLAFTGTILGSHGWKALSRSHEIGLFVEGWPDDTAEHWAFDRSQKPLLTGISQLLEAQKHVNERTGQEDPGEGLAGAGIKALAPTRYSKSKKKEENRKKDDKPIMTGIPTSGIDGEPALRRRSSLANKGNNTSPKKSPKAFKVVKPRKEERRSKSKIDSKGVHAPSSDGMGVAPPPPVGEKANQLDNENATLPPDSQFLRSRIIGTTSAKMSYLVSQILKYHKEEKILVFYDGDNVAYYIAQMLELLHIKHEIYAKSLAAHLKSEYVVRFDQEIQDRVLLMDVRNAAFGLNLPSASRIYFVNPVCRPNIEAQAIKRAHRIGQTRKVWCETLVLKDTIEEKMLDRSKRMTRSEHQDARVLEDDKGIREIIQSARILPVRKTEKSGYGQMAPLEEQQQLWSRPGWRGFAGSPKSHTPNDKKRKFKGDDNKPDEDVAADEPRQPKKVRRSLAFVDCSKTGDGNARSGVSKQEDGDDEPLASRYQTSPSNLSTPHRLGMVREHDPYMPPTASPGSDERLTGITPKKTQQSTLLPDLPPNSTQGLHQPRLSIPDLLNPESPTSHADETAKPSLLQNILHLL